MYQNTLGFQTSSISFPLLPPELNPFTYSSSSHSSFASRKTFAIFLADVCNKRNGPCISVRTAPVSFSPVCVCVCVCVCMREREGVYECVCVGVTSIINTLKPN